MVPTTYHGTLVSVNGVGILITGKPGIGKSRLAVDLLNRGHQFICDDATDIFVKSTVLIGRPPPLIAHQLWLNNFGLIDVKKHWGAQAVLSEKKIDFFLELTAELQILSFGKETFLNITLPQIKIFAHFSSITTFLESLTLPSFNGPSALFF